MQVIKKGRDQQGWAREFECTGAGNRGGGCGSILLVEETDLFQTSNTDYTGDTDYYITFRCPNCQVLTDIKDSDSPTHARNLPREDNSVR